MFLDRARAAHAFVSEARKSTHFHGFHGFHGFLIWDHARPSRKFVHNACKSTHFHGFGGKSCSYNCQRVMEISMKEDMSIADMCLKSILLPSFGKKSYSWNSEGHENWHEGGDRRCQQNDIFRSGIVRAQRVHLCAKRANPLIFMVFWGKVAA